MKNVYAQGCLFEDTLVSMVDGSERKIRDIRPGDIITDLVSNYRVVDTLRGIENRLVYFETDNEQYLASTENHPILTSSGFKKAKNLTENEEILSVNGTNKITFIFKEFDKNVYENLLKKGNADFSEKLQQLYIKPTESMRVYNLILENNKCDSSNNGGTFFANGIKVGDMTIQHQIYNK